MLDSTMINIAIKQLNHTFNSPLDVQWGITGYVLALAIAVPFSGWLMNQFINGKKCFIFNDCFWLYVDTRWRELEYHRI